MEYEFNKRDLEALQAAIRRSPEKVKTLVKDFMSRGIAEYKKQIIRNPWRLGMTGGGSPVDTGHLRDTHRTEIQDWQARIFPTAPYAPYVHGIDGMPRKRTYQLRPWLDFAFDTANPAIKNKEAELLEKIVNDLAQ